MVGIPDFVFRSPHTKKQSNFAAATRRLAHVRGSTGGSTRGNGGKRNFSGTRRGPDGAAAGGTRKLNPRPSSQSRSEVGSPHYPETSVYTTCLSWSTIGMALAPAGPDVSCYPTTPSSSNARRRGHACTRYLHVLFSRTRRYWGHTIDKPQCTSS